MERFLGLFVLEVLKVYKSNQMKRKTGPVKSFWENSNKINLLNLLLCYAEE